MLFDDLRGVRGLSVFNFQPPSMTSSTYKSRKIASLALSFAVLLFPVLVRAQAASPANPAVPPPRPEQDIIKLDPFEVVTSKDTSYGALNSNSITQFNT